MKNTQLGRPPFQCSNLQSTVTLNTHSHTHRLCFVRGLCRHTANFKLRGLCFCYSSSSPVNLYYSLCLDGDKHYMLLYSHVFWGISLDFSWSGTSADVFNKHEDPFPAQSSGCLCGSKPTVQFRLLLEKKPKGPVCRAMVGVGPKSCEGPLTIIFKQGRRKTRHRGTKPYRCLWAVTSFWEG